MEENYTQFTMRMDNSLYEQLKASALRNRRSIAKELEHITDLYLNRIQYSLPENITNAVINELKDSGYFSEMDAGMLGRSRFIKKQEASSAD